MSERILRVKDASNGSKKLLKIIDVSDLDSIVVSEVVDKMNRVNEMNIDGLLKYKVIKVCNNSLFRISREYKVVLSKINPLKYFEENGVYDVLNDILNVLKRLNEIGLFHSDLKPSNMFLNDENEIIIGDYLNNLLYKGREEMKQDRNRKDICFVSIDELMGLELDILSDIWNFGLIFYYVLSGKYAFLGSNILKTLENIRDVKYIPLDCECNNKINCVLRRILVKERKDRMKLSEITSDLKMLNDPELPVVPFEKEDEIKLSPENNIDYRYDKYIKENANVDMKDDGMKYFCSRLKIMNHVIKIDLCVNNLTVAGLDTLSEYLKNFPNLSVLYISGNTLGSIVEKKKSYLERLFYKTESINISNGLKSFSENLYLLPRLTQLGFGDCKLIDEDMEYLSSNFKYIPNLIWIAISTNNIADKGVKSFCNNINYIPKLEVLYFHRNDIGDVGGELFLNNIHKLTKLRIFTSCNNKISNYKYFVEKIRNKHPNKEIKIDY